MFLMGPGWDGRRSLLLPWALTMIPPALYAWPVWDGGVPLTASADDLGAKGR